MFNALAKAFSQLSDPAVLRVLAKSVLVTLLIFAVLAVGAYFGLSALFAVLGLGDRGFVSAALAVVLTVVAGWVLFRVVAVAVLQFFADEVVIAVERKHYPAAAQSARALPFTEDLANSLRGIGRTIAVNLLALPLALVLLVTGVGPAIVFLGANAWLLGRELTDMAWLRHRQQDETANPVPRGQRISLGLVVAAIMLVPFANLIGPVLGAAAGTHLTHRAITRDKGRNSQ